MRPRRSRAPAAEAMPASGSRGTAPAANGTNTAIAWVARYSSGARSVVRTRCPATRWSLKAASRAAQPPPTMRTLSGWRSVMASLLSRDGDGNLEDCQRPHPAVGKLDIHDVAALCAAQCLPDRGGQGALVAIVVRAPAADEPILRGSARVILDPDQRPEGRAVAGRGLVHDRGRREKSLELRDADPVDRGVLEGRQPLVVVSGLPNIRASRRR